jgi:ATP-dependent DNA helicase RecQ
VAASPFVSDADSGVLDRLRALRTRLARAQNVPAYVVFSDRTLVELATHRPSTLAAMREIHGIGDAKLERYGAEFLAAIEPRRP